LETELYTFIYLLGDNKSSQEAYAAAGNSWARASIFQHVRGTRLL